MLKIGFKEEANLWADINTKQSTYLKTGKILKLFVLLVLVFSQF